MIGAHFAGVAFESWRGRENLARAMVTGNKAAHPGSTWIRAAGTQSPARGPWQSL